MGAYPFSTELEPGPGAGGWSVLLVGLHHRLHARFGVLPGAGWRRRAQLARWLGLMEGLGWALHPYLCGPPGRAVAGRRFAPARVLSPSTHDAMLGTPGCFPTTVSEAPRAQWRWIEARLDQRDGGCRHAQPVLLTRASAGGLGPDVALEVALPPWRGGPWAAGEGRRCRFRICWADLWLFADADDLSPMGNAVLALKVEPLALLEADVQRPCTVGTLAELNRALRDLVIDATGTAWVRPAGSDAPCFNLWERLLADWLGAEPDLDGGPRLLLASRPGATAKHPANLLLLRTADALLADQHSEYARVLTAARIPPPDGDSGWDQPLGTPLDDPADGGPREHAIAAPWVLMQARASGYPTLGDGLLYELASTTSEGAAVGLAEDRFWCVSPEYLRAVLARSGVEIWADWKGLALRDCCAFLAWAPMMPILHQAEERYYPLYLHTYYAQLRLHHFSERIVERELTDLPRARAIRHAFMQFRNQFWFREAATRFQGIDVGNAMHAGMGLDDLYASVDAEVEQVGGYVDEKANAGRQRLIALILFLFWPLGLLLEASEDELETYIDQLALWELALHGVALIGATIMAYALLAGTVGRQLVRAGDWLRRRGVV